jgi:hypothetical protein
MGWVSVAAGMQQRRRLSLGFKWGKCPMSQGDTRAPHATFFASLGPQQAIFSSLIRQSSRLTSTSRQTGSISAGQSTMLWSSAFRGVVAPAQELGMRLRVLWRKPECRRQRCRRFIKISHCSSLRIVFSYLSMDKTPPTVLKPANCSAAEGYPACGGIRELERVKRGRRKAVAM